MNGTCSSRVNSFRRPAVSNTRSRDSTTQGPAMRKSAWSRPALKPHRSMGSCRQSGLALARLIVHRGLDEGLEQRVAAARRGSEFRVELAAEEPGMRGQLDDL